MLYIWLYILLYICITIAKQKMLPKKQLPISESKLYYMPLEHKHFQYKQI